MTGIQRIIKYMSEKYVDTELVFRYNAKEDSLNVSYQFIGEDKLTALRRVIPLKKILNNAEINESESIKNLKHIIISCCNNLHQNKNNL